MDMPKKPQKPVLLSKARKALFLGCGVFHSLFAIGSLVIIIATFDFEDLEEDIGLLFLSIFVFLLFAGLAAVSFVSANEKKKKQLYQDQLKQYELDMIQYEKENPFYREIEFYQVCLEKYKIQNTTVADVARMKLAAKELALNWDEKELAKKYILGKKELNKFNERKKAQKEEAASQEKIKSLLNKQNSYQQYVMNRLSMTGLDKRVQYLKDVISTLEKERDSADKDYHDMISLGVNYKRAVDKNDSNWATLGGIAEGIAGPAAGLAVASQAYAQGEKERQARVETANQLNASLLNVALSSIDKEIAAKEKIELYKKMLADTDCLLTNDDLPQRNLMELIKPQDISVTQVVPGLICLNFNTNATTLSIYETVQAYVDGFFKILVKKNGVAEFENYYELSNENGSTESCSFVAYVKGNEKDSYSIDYEPVHLWAVESTAQ